MPAAAAPCANPLFLQWLEELRDAAREKGLKTANIYAAACRSVAACPIKYDRARELVQLQGIGPKTVAILETRLKAHCEANGIVLPPTPSKRRAGSTNQEEQAGKDTADGQPSLQPVKKRRVTKPKVYIPPRGSGAYGILIGLLLAVTDPETTIQVFLTKGELVRASQPYCDTSYDHSDRGNHFTAWSGMKTLVNKGYVYTSGSPQRFCLTEDGYDVAVTVRNLHPAFVHLPKLYPLGNESEESACSAFTLGPEPVPKNKRSGAKFAFWYIGAGGARVDDLSAAMMRLDPEDYTTLRKIEFRMVQITHPIVGQLRMIDSEAVVRDESGLPSLFAFIVEETAPPRCSRFDSVEKTEAPLEDVSSLEPEADAEESLVSLLVGPSRSFSRTHSNLVGSSSRPPGPRLSAQLPLPDEDRPVPDFDVSDAITFPHGTYEIVLILDTREIESKSSRDKLYESLAAKGVKVETRALRLGDMCWVARKLGLASGTGSEEDECVLDYVVERKRLDDLCGSIRDGRYHEQCFRLSKSCIGNIFYVVEDWQLAERMEYHGKQIMTVKSQIQVVNGFFLKETHRLADTIDFLVTLTQVITDSYRDIAVIPSRYLSRSSYTTLQRHLRNKYPETPYHTSFEAYQALNDKSGSRTLQERFARMLLCVRGMSPERVGALLECWDTPLALYKAMCERAERGTVIVGKRTRGVEMMFADQIKGEGRRKFGDALSRDLWRALWGDEVHDE